MKRVFCTALLLIAPIATDFGSANSEEVGAKERLRLALVIGNAQYSGNITELKNATHDAIAMVRQLRSTGFEVIEAIDQDHNSTVSAIAAFRNRLQPNSIALFYYAGHGVSVNGINYMIPLGADIKHSDDVPYKAIDIHKILYTMTESNDPMHGVNIMILDACRNNPFSVGLRSLNAGLSKFEAAGTLIAYATEYGKAAYDGEGSHSPFTASLLEEMMIPNRPIEQVFKEVRKSVAKSTQQAQIPTTESTLLGDFSFVNLEQSPQDKINHITERIHELSQVRPTTLVSIEQIEALYDQLNSMAPGHALLQTRAAQLVTLHTAAVHHLLQKPEMAVRAINKINAHIYQLSLLDPDKVAQLHLAQRINDAYRLIIQQLQHSGQFDEAIELSQQALRTTEDHSFSMLTETLRLQKRKGHQGGGALKPNAVSPGQTVSKHPISNQSTLANVTFSDPNMNCSTNAPRFTKIAKTFHSPTKQHVLAREYVKDRCSELEWLTLGVERTRRESLLSCKALKEGWALISAEDISKLMTTEQFPGHGGMMDQRFFPEAHSTGPQKTYWTKSKERGRFLLVSGVSGQKILTINQNRVGSVICRRSTQ